MSALPFHPAFPLRDRSLDLLRIGMKVHFKRPCRLSLEVQLGIEGNAHILRGTGTHNVFRNPLTVADRGYSPWAKNALNLLQEDRSIQNPLPLREGTLENLCLVRHFLITAL